MRTAMFSILLLLSASFALAQSPNAGQQAFVSRCAGCHGSDGNGGELGPAITGRVPSRTDQDLITLFKQGLPTAGMPAFPNLAGAASADLIRYLRTLRPRSGSAPVRTKITPADGSAPPGPGLHPSPAHPQPLRDG